MPVAVKTVHDQVNNEEDTKTVVLSPEKVDSEESVCVLEGEEACEETRLSTDEEQTQQCKLFVGGLHQDVTEDKLREILKPYGEILECLVKCSGDNGSKRGFAFVTFSSPDSAKKALQDHSEQSLEVDNKPVDLKLAQPKGSNRQGRHIVRQRNKVFIGGLSSDTTEDDLRNHFYHFGQVMEAELKYDKHTSRHRGFGFVTFQSAESAQDACKNHFQKIKGKKVEIKEALPPELLGMTRPKKPHTNQNYHGYPSPMVAPYAMYPWAPGYMGVYYGPPMMDGNNQGGNVPMPGYAYIGYGGPNSHMSRGSDFNGSQDYLAEQFQNMSVGPRHMYPMVPMAMDHPMSYSGPNQYGMPMQYPSSHPPSPPSNVTSYRSSPATQSSQAAVMVN